MPKVTTVTWIELQLSKPKLTWGNYVSFFALERWVISGVERGYVYAIKSQMICDWNLISQPLSSLTCDCLAADSTQGKDYVSTVR
jgi:hypothetical protein